MLVGFVWFGLARYLLGLFGFWFERSVGLPREMHIYPLGEAVMAVWTCLQMPVQSIKLLMGTSQTRTSSANHHCNGRCNTPLRKCPFELNQVFADGTSLLVKSSTGSSQGIWIKLDLRWLFHNFMQI